MIQQRQPLKDVHNVNSNTRKMPKTYGKKTKSAASIQAAKQLFTVTDDLEKRLASVTISEEPENQENIPGNNIQDQVQSLPSAVQEPSTHAKQTPATKSRATRVEYGTKESIGLYATPELSSYAPLDDESVLQRFVRSYSDRGILSFEKYGNTISKRYDVRKIGEGTYSSVFELSRRDEFQAGTSSSASQSSQPMTTNGSEETSQYRTTILKMMPILLPSMGDLEGMTEPFHIASELETMRTMDPVHGFIRYRGLLVVKGPWPSSFLEAFRHFTRYQRRKAENEDPETAYSDNQYYALIEMEHAGTEMNDIKRPSDFQIYDIFWQIAIYLSIAEDSCGFEHRDLHVSNICTKPDDPLLDRVDVTKETVSTMTARPSQVLGMSNISATIIDYTFSRAELPPDLHHSPLKETNFREFKIEGKDYDSLLSDLASTSTKKTLSKSGEDFENRIQQLTYAKVAKLVDLADQAAERSGTVYDAISKRRIAPWEQFVPRTNVAWLGYLLTCLLGRAGKMAKTKYVTGSNSIAKEVQDEIRKKMIEVRDVLVVDEVEMMLGSAAEVVRVGLERGWLGLEEIECFKQKLEQDC